MICTRILDLVAELLSHAAKAHNAVCARRLCERERAVRVGLNNRVAHVVPLLILVVSEQAASALGRALDEVAGTSPHAELVILVRLPPKLMHEDAECQGTVHHTARDDDVCALGQGFRDGHGAKIGVCARELHVRHSLPGEHLLPASLPQLIDALRQVVPEDSANLHVDLGLLADRLQRIAASKWVHASRVDDYLDALLLQRLDVSGDHLDNRAGVPHALVLLPLTCQDCHRQLSQVVTHEVINIPLLDQLELRQRDIAPHGAEAADADA
mmetsp:Transcript_98947/g.262820  ORF Transcript_98947/g.262820 Transcript_98947/m.262820 type:complete len:270 (-) Transcript_98947:97-906(-)